jgi:hypothetical protein
MTDEDMKELKRLQSLQCHLDTYEVGKYSFNYHEMLGIASITVYDMENFQSEFRNYTVDPMSHQDFEKWCLNYMKNP